MGFNKGVLALAVRPIMIARRPSGFIEPCEPSKVARPPSGPLWVHELKHDGYRLMVRRDCSQVRCFTRNGYDWADRFPAIVDAALRLKASSFLIDREAVIARDDGTPDFHALRSRRRAVRRCCTAFDLIEHDDEATRNEAVDAGCIAYLRKPFASQVLLDAIGKAVA
jgi:bifunctional non-homologous end joining protein LigD